MSREDLYYDEYFERWELSSKEMDEFENTIYNQAIDEVSRAMYHQCFECNNDENMQKWDSGNWIRYKLFENVIEQLKEQNNDD